MSATLIDAVRSAFTVDIQNKMAALLGEREENIQRALHGAIPLVLIDILHKSYHSEPAAKVWELSRQATTSVQCRRRHQLIMAPDPDRQHPARNTRRPPGQNGPRYSTLSLGNTRPSVA